MIDSAIRAAIRAAAITYDFRGKRPGESDKRYRDAVIAHVETRDMARAHELRVGKRQADWTPAEAQAFADRMMTDWHGPSTEMTSAVMQVVETKGHAVTDDGLLRLAHECFDNYVEMRRKAPTKELAIIPSVLLMDGRCLSTAVGRV